MIFFFICVNNLNNATYISLWDNKTRKKLVICPYQQKDLIKEKYTERLILCILILNLEEIKWDYCCIKWL